MTIGFCLNAFHQMNYRPDNQGWADGNVPIHPTIQYFGNPPPNYRTLHQVLGVSADHGYYLVHVDDEVRNLPQGNFI